MVRVYSELGGNQLELSLLDPNMRNTQSKPLLVTHVYLPKSE
jgi:hypothetical protein